MIDLQTKLTSFKAGEETLPGVTDILTGHTDVVNTVKFVPETDATIITGSVDKTLRIWTKNKVSKCYSCTQVLTEHQNSLNCIAVDERGKLFATGSADSTVKIWSVDEQNVATLKQSITITPRFFPLALALSPLSTEQGSYILAVAGTKDIIQLYVLDPNQSPDFTLQATLSGHEGWIRSLEFTPETFAPNADLILASASQDKYIRLWRIHQGKELPTAAANQDPSLGSFMPGRSLSNKAHRFKAGELDYSATFEALLLGHEDWIYSTKWRSYAGDKLQLLSASADNSLAIWQPDETTGVWVTIARLGEISQEKGSTTATGSTGGFWAGLWSPSGETVVTLGRTGSWRLWDHDIIEDRWVQNVGTSGHVQSVTGIAWSKDGEYLLSTSSDQTTRLHAQWKEENRNTWHEMARPQIHGYDLNCIDSLGLTRFVSGADEKLLRVFDEPKSVATLLSKLSKIGGSHIEEMPDAADMPVLGLSNKAIEEGNSAVQENGNIGGEPLQTAPVPRATKLELEHPPLEDQLSRHTLWPEIEKLYGHGYEISTLAASHDGTLIATACRASSIDHAVIRIFETKNWLEIKPPLTAHASTITRLRFSADDSHLLSVGRDRQWAVFQRDGTSQNYKLLEANPKGHTRMILDVAWLPNNTLSFVTAGREKQVKIWAKDNGSEQFVCKATIPQDSPVTAIDALDTPFNDKFYVALGTEAGKLSIYAIDSTSHETTAVEVTYSR